jgi:hypothetical protein
MITATTATATTTHGPICIKTLMDSWHNLESAFEKVHDAVVLSKESKAGFYKIYHCFSGKKEMTTKGFIEMAVNDIYKVLPQFCMFTKEETLQFREHLARYHSGSNLDDLPIQYIRLLKQWFALKIALYFPNNN